MENIICTPNIMIFPKYIYRLDQKRILPPKLTYTSYIFYYTNLLTQSQFLVVCFNPVSQQEAFKS